MDKNFVDSYRELNCIANLNLGNIARVVAAEPQIDEIKAIVNDFRYKSTRGVDVIRVAMEVANHFYSVIAEWIGIPEVQHYVCLSISDDGVDIREVETTDKKNVNLINYFITNIQTNREFPIRDFVIHVVYLMIYEDLVISKTRGNKIVDPRGVKSVIVDSADDIISHVEKILDERAGST